MTIHQKQAITIAVVGDVHDQWEQADNDALEQLNIDLILFVGDFGNESVPVVRKISEVSIPKAVIMGNHDAWYTASAWGRKQCPYNRQQEDWLEKQLELLGEIHIGYSKLDFPQFNLSVVGSRPYSWGGPEWKNKSFLRDRYQVSNFAESTAKIMAAVQETSETNIIFLGHNGPTGLGQHPEAICGKDWQPLGGDHGDPDFAQAIAQTYDLGKKIPLVTFGHMHHRLRHTRSQLRTRLVTNEQGTVYLNAACVPRIIEENGQKLRNFSLVSLDNGKVSHISLVWVDNEGAITTEDRLYEQPILSPIN
ncbi:metallophosphoesterase [Crocosphaera subtropica ATCC 51142]|uniref:Metallophosphoesterase n=1 Tax=Crocosphaera subtropica (strain ATCC 51142 / BH68) TaxID=43989 RepID=B1WZ73_CROS5|nr:TIGR04168 family protein [Crocosphaera subtropica]ACB49439.1 metallophosphoesterase [Crocosphaera subtropica ATCC 51142]